LFEPAPVKLAPFPQSILNVVTFSPVQTTVELTEFTPVVGFAERLVQEGPTTATTTAVGSVALTVLPDVTPTPSTDAVFV
jgi:hypothetical protein